MWRNDCLLKRAFAADFADFHGFLGKIRVNSRNPRPRFFFSRSTVMPTFITLRVPRVLCGNAFIGSELALKEKNSANTR